MCEGGGIITEFYGTCCMHATCINADFNLNKQGHFTKLHYKRSHIQMSQFTPLSLHYMYVTRGFFNIIYLDGRVPIHGAELRHDFSKRTFSLSLEHTVNSMPDKYCTAQLSSFGCMVEYLGKNLHAARAIP